MNHHYDFIQFCRKKEKMAHCSAVAENICSQANVKNSSEFSKYLTVATEMFFTLSNDEDSDIRILADECLTRVVKNLSESGTNVGRMQVELYKEIKKNGSSRSLRSALTKFAAICDQIRPQKCRAYIVNLIPCLIKIASTRKEEAVHETLADTMKIIFSYLGHYTNDNEGHQLLKTFLNNLTDQSASIRRSTASILISLCQGSRKPAYFLLWLFSTIMDSIVPCADLAALKSEKVLGVLVGTRAIVPLLDDHKEALELDTEHVLHRCVQLYETCLCLLDSKDNIIIAQALESLQQLLKTPPSIFKHIIVSPSGILQSSIAPNEGETEAPSFSSTDQPHFASSNEPLEDLEDDDKTNDFDRGRIKLMDSIDVPPTPRESMNANPVEIEEDMDSDVFKESETKPSESKKTSTSAAPQLDKIGAFTDKDVPLIYCSRKLVSKFLISDRKGELVPDNKVRVSLKALAMGCLTQAVAMSPKVFLLTLLTDGVRNDSNQFMLTNKTLYLEFISRMRRIQLLC